MDKVFVVIDEGIWDGTTCRGAHICSIIDNGHFHYKGFLTEEKAQAFADAKVTEAIEDEEGDPRVADRFKVREIEIEE